MVAVRLTVLSLLILSTGNLSVYGHSGTRRDASVQTPSAVDFAHHPWKAPGPNDVRSPCPALNALANHGILPRSGKNMNVPQILKAALDAFNIQAGVILLAAKLALTTTSTPDTFSLDDLRIHNNIEHDASLSRQDHDIGNNWIFNETIYQTLATSNPGVDYYNATSAGRVQKQRLDISRATNPKLINTQKEIVLRSQESCLYLSAMGNVTAGTAPKKFVDVLFREERLPIEEGWVRSPVPITPDAMSGMLNAIIRESQWTPNEGQCPSLVVLGGNGFTLI